jgi:hypothetical protein
MTADFLMTKPAFANLPFGQWSEVLAGQIKRNHYLFAVDGANRAQCPGLGVGVPGQDRGVDRRSRWPGLRRLPRRQLRRFQYLDANRNTVHRFPLDQARKIMRGRTMVNGKRHDGDGVLRPVRPSVNAFVNSHVARKRRRRPPLRPPPTSGPISTQRANEAAEAARIGGNS